MSTDPNRIRDIEIDTAIRRSVQLGDGLHVTIREAGGLRRTLAEFTLDEHQTLALMRGSSATAERGTVAAEFAGGDALVDALDAVTSTDGKLTDRSPANIADDLLDDLGMNVGQARSDYVRRHALLRALRSKTPRPIRPTEEG